MSDLDPHGVVMRQFRQLLQHTKDHIVELPGDERDQAEMDDDLTTLFSAFPYHIEGFTVAFGTLVGAYGTLMADMQRLRVLEGCYIIFPREENTGYLERSALVECQVRRLIDDVKKGVAGLRSELAVDENVYEPSVDKDKKELGELQAEITKIRNELEKERSAHRLTKQSLETSTESLDKKLQVIIDHSNTKSSVRVRVVMAKDNLKAILCLPRQNFDKKNVQG